MPVCCCTLLECLYRYQELSGDRKAQLALLDKWLDELDRGLGPQLVQVMCSVTPCCVSAKTLHLFSAGIPFAARCLPGVCVFVAAARAAHDQLWLLSCPLLTYLCCRLLSGFFALLLVSCRLLV